MIDMSKLKNLTFASGVKRTTITDRAIKKLDEYFVKHNKKGVITSILRDIEKQLSIIEYYAKKHKIIEDWEHLELPIIWVIPWEMRHQFNMGDVIHYWQYVWSRLLEIGIIISPPIRARALFNYFRNGINKKGRWINPSPHFDGTCFDIGGGSNGAQDEYSIIQLASKDIPEIVYILFEHGNNCVHVRCKEIKAKQKIFTVKSPSEIHTVSLKEGTNDKID